MDESDSVRSSKWFDVTEKPKCTEKLLLLSDVQENITLVYFANIVKSIDLFFIEQVIRELK